MSLKQHFQQKSRSFHSVPAEATFVIRIQDGARWHLFTIKMTADCRFYTHFKVQSKMSKAVADFILRWDHDLEDPVYIRERDRYVMLVHQNQCCWIGMSSFCPLTLSLYQAEKLMKQIYEWRLYPGY